jgi:carbamoyl-phosphate synthase large subunit
MAVVFSQEELAAYLAAESPSWPLLVDRFLEDAIELDVDALCDGTSCHVAAILEHVEAAGIHSGDSACVTPPQETGPGAIAQIERQTAAIAVRLGAVGLVNVQFALQDGQLFVIEANPRASRTVPFVAKATGLQLVHHAVRLMLGETIADLDLPEERVPHHVSVKEAVLPFARFPLTDPTLGPEMRSTGEVMGVGGSFGEAFAKAQRGAGAALPTGGIAVISTADMDKPRAVGVAQRLSRSGFTLVATDGTAAAIRAAGLPVTPVAKLDEGATDIPALIARGGVALVVNTPSGRRAQTDGMAIRLAAVRAGIPCITTMEAAEATTDALRGPHPTPLALQDILGERLVTRRAR